MARAPAVVPVPVDPPVVWVAWMVVVSVVSGAVTVPVPVAVVLGDVVELVDDDVPVVGEVEVLVVGAVEVADVVVDGDGVPSPSPPAALCRTVSWTGVVRPSMTTEPSLP
jgi:hypothetical protein